MNVAQLHKANKSHQTHRHQIGEISGSTSPSHGQHTANGASLVTELIRTRPTRARTTANEYNAPILLSQRQRTVLVLEQNSRRCSEITNKLIVVILDINVLVGLIRVGEEGVKVDRWERRRILVHEIP